MFAAYSPGGRSNDAVSNGNNAVCISVTVGFASQIEAKRRPD